MAGALWQEPEHTSPDLRYELGIRVRAMEIAFERARTKPALRREALPHLEASVSAFFSLDLQGAAKALDEARGVLASREPSVYDCLAVAPNAWILEPGEHFRLTVTQIYPAKLPEPLVVHVPRTKEQFEVESLPFTYDFGPMQVPQHPTGLVGEFYGVSFGGRASIVSANPEIIPDVRARARDMQSLRMELGEEGLAPWVMATTRLHLEFLSAMLRGNSLETKLPGELFLTRTEQLLRADQDELVKPGALWRWARENDDTAMRLRSGVPRGQEWIALPREQGRDEIRLYWPGAPESERPPLVVALHGAGGSENMFFDGYGNGKAVSLARSKGWFIAAPKVDAGFNLARTIPQLVELLGADPDRVFVIGHSMGAARAMASAAALADAEVPIAGMILLGGGRPVQSEATLAALKALPLFIQAGVRDFALPGAEALIAQLEEHGHPRLTKRTVPDCEHLTVVQAALDQSYEWMQWLLDQRAE